VTRIPAGDNWAHEIKFGFRMHARIVSGAAALLTRNGLDWTAKYSDVAAAIGALNCRQAYVDGELCAVLPDGTTSFADLQGRGKVQQQNGNGACALRTRRKARSPRNGCARGPVARLAQPKRSRACPRCSRRGAGRSRSERICSRRSDNRVRFMGWESEGGENFRHTERDPNGVIRTETVVRQPFVIDPVALLHEYLSPHDSQTQTDDTPFSLTKTEIKQAQTALVDAGHKIAIDGVEGPLTGAAVEAFQRENNLAPTGKLDRVTLKQLGVLVRPG
jgi:hypothetical protein